MMLQKFKTVKSVQILVTLLVLICFQEAVFATQKDRLAYSGFGYLTLYKPTKTVSNVIICISGDGGWNSGIEGIALHLKNENTLLIGVDIRQVFKSMKKKKISMPLPCCRL
ncbi:hypothetical protein QWY99_09485 [Flavobacterium branchiarum]|uniref:Uncharacterized protein n=1 Tax=Flavobacterium branchiarum TaxID=1114870 RepID=A0ABV5FQE0_9FLAO|nr:hypothetical protein [Flavobacterium branchiarum]MDN3673280.1 hypothetical protein [Flavobacterium branchiarum]